jgi:hypothetical protein
LLLCNVQIFRCLHRHLLKFPSLQCCVASAACTGIYSAQSIAATTVDPAFCGSDLPHGFGGPRSEFLAGFHDQWQFQHHMLQLQCCGFQCVTCFNVFFLWGFSTRPTLPPASCQTPRSCISVRCADQLGTIQRRFAADMPCTKRATIWRSQTLGLNTRPQHLPPKRDNRRCELMMNTNLSCCATRIPKDKCERKGLFCFGH